MENNLLIKRFVIVVFISAFVSLYLWGAFMHGTRVNTSMVPADQARYLEIVKKIKSDPFYFGDRNRMPLYSYFQSLFYSRTDSDYLAFTRAKAINVFLSIGLLAILYLRIRKSLSLLSNVSFIVVSAFTLFVVRAAYFQVELTYYVASFFSLWELNRLLRSPSIKQGVLTGVLVGVTYLLKASILLGVQTFLVFSVILILREILFSRKQSRFQMGIWRKRAFSIIGFIGMFLTVLSPYLIQNKRIFGKYFYNVNTNFYVWYDSIGEAASGTGAHGDTIHWPEMEESEIPSMKRYLTTHSRTQILEREGVNLVRLLYIAVVTSTAYLYAVLLGIVFIYVSILDRGFVRAIIDKYGLSLLFSTIVFGIYYAAFAWYIPIDAGSRFILSLFLPLFFVLHFVLNSSDYLTRSHKSFRGYSLLDVVNLVIIAIVCVDYATVTNLILRTIQQY